MKKIIALLLAVLMVVAMFTACAKKAEEPAAEAPKAEEPAKEEPAAEEPAAEEPAAEEPAAEGPAELDLVLFRGGYGGLWDEMVELFKSYYPNCNVTADIADDVVERVRTRMLTETPPDVICYSADEYDVYEAARSGMVRDMSDFFANGTTADGVPMSEAVGDGVNASGIMNGKLFFPVWGTGYGGWWYDATLFEANGWEIPETWDDLLALCEEIKATGIDPFIYQGAGACNYVIWGFMYQAVAAAGGYEAFEDAFNHLTPGAWTSEPVIKAATQMQELVQKGYLSKNSVGIEFTQAQIDFVNNKAALIPCGSWFETEMIDSTPETVKMTMIPFPAQDADGNNYLCAFDCCHWVPEGCVHPEAAEAWMGVVYSKEGQKLVAKYGQLPVANTVTAEDIADYMTPCMTSVVECAQKGNVKFVNNLSENWYTPMRPAMQDAITDLILEEITPEEFGQIVEDAAEELRNSPDFVQY